MSLNFDGFKKLSDKDKIAAMNAINSGRTRRDLLKKFKNTTALKKVWKVDAMQITMKPLAEIPSVKKESTIAYEQVVTQFNSGAMDKAELICKDTAAGTLATALRRAANVLGLANVGVLRFKERVMLVKIDKQSEALKARFAKKAKKAKK